MDNLIIQKETKNVLAGPYKAVADAAPFVGKDALYMAARWLGSYGENLNGFKLGDRTISAEDIAGAVNNFVIGAAGLYLVQHFFTEAKPRIIFMGGITAAMLVPSAALLYRALTTRGTSLSAPPPQPIKASDKSAVTVYLAASALAIASLRILPSSMATYGVLASSSLPLAYHFLTRGS